VDLLVVLGDATKLLGAGLRVLDGMSHGSSFRVRRPQQKEAAAQLTRAAESPSGEPPSCRR
jgi:hypothetical protein